MKCACSSADRVCVCASASSFGTSYWRFDGFLLVLFSFSSNYYYLLFSSCVDSNSTNKFVCYHPIIITMIIYPRLPHLDTQVPIK